MQGEDCYVGADSQVDRIARLKGVAAHVAAVMCGGTRRAGHTKREHGEACQGRSEHLVAAHVPQPTGLRFTGRLSRPPEERGLPAPSLPVVQPRRGELLTGDPARCRTEAAVSAHDSPEGCRSTASDASKEQRSNAMDDYPVE
jgi:hypothetical protein